MRSLNTLTWSKNLLFRWFGIFFYPWASKWAPRRSFVHETQIFKILLLESTCEIFTISPKVRGGCVAVARNPKIIWHKDRGCGFFEYFDMTKKFVFRWLGIFSIFWASKWPPRRAFFHEMRLQLALRDWFWVSSAQNRQRSGYWLKAIRIVFFQVLVLRKDRNGTYNL